MQIPPQNSSAVGDQMLQVALQQDYWLELVKLLQREMQAATTPEAGIKLRLEIAKIQADGLKNHEAAYQSLAEALQIAPEYAPLLAVCQQFALQHKSLELFDKATQAQLKLLEKSNNTSMLAARHFAIGKAWLQVFSNSHNAAVHLQQAMTLDYTHTELLPLLSQALEAEKNYPALADLYRQQLDNNPQAPAKALRIKLFFLLFYKLRQTDAAIEILQPLANDPSDQQPLLLLNRALLHKKRWQELANNLHLLATYTKDEKLIHNYLAQRAEICHTKCSQVDSAITDLKTLLQTAPHDRLALERLSMIYRNEQQHLKLISILQAQADLAASQARLDDQMAHYLEMVELWEGPLGQPDKALQLLRAAVAQLPRALPLITALARRLHTMQAWDELQALYHAELACAEDDNQKLSLYYRIAYLYESALKNTEQAMQYYRKALVLSPNYLPAQQRLQGLYIQQQAWQELIDLFELELTGVDNPNRAIYLLNRIGSIYEEKLNNADAATTAYMRLLKIDKEHIPTIGALARLFYAKGDWEKLAQLNMQEAALCGDPRQSISLYYNSGTVYADKLQRYDKAALCYQNVLSISPTYVPALRALGQIYAQQKNWGGLIAMYHREAQVHSLPEKQYYLLTRIADIMRHQLQDSQGAEKVLLEVMLRNPNYLPAARVLENIFLEASRYDDLAKLYQSMVGHADVSDDIAGPYNLKLAKLLHLELDNDEASLPHYLNAIDYGYGIDISISALDQIYSRLSRYDELADILLEVSRKVTEPAYLSNLYYRLGIVEIEYLDAIEHGIAHLLQAHALQNESPALVWDLIHYLERYGKWQKLADLFEQQAQQSQEPAQRLAILEQAADAFSKANNPQKAAEVLEGILKIKPDELRIIHALMQLYRQLDANEKLAMTYRQYLALESDNNQRLNATLELARLYDEKLSQADKAIALLGKCFDEMQEPHHSVIMAYEKILLQHQSWDKLIQAYPKMLSFMQADESQHAFKMRFAAALEQTEAYSEAIDVYQQLLRQQPHHADIRTRLKILLQRTQSWQPLLTMLEQESGFDSQSIEPLQKMAQIYSETLQDYLNAKLVLEKALARDPQNLSTVAMLASAYHQLQEWTAYLDTSQQHLKLLQGSDPNVELSLYLQRAQVYSQQLQKYQEALRELESGLARQPDNAEFLQAKAITHLAAGQWQEALQAYQRYLAVLEKSLQPPILHQMGEIYRQQLHDIPQCIAYNEQALTIQADFAPSLQCLKEIYQATKAWQPLAAIYQKSIAALAGQAPQKTIPLHMLLAELQQNQLQQPNLAISQYQKVVKIDPSLLPAHQQLAVLYGASKPQHNLAINEYIYLLQHGESDPKHFHAVAKLYEEDGKLDQLCRTYEVMDFLQLLNPGDREIYKSYAARIPAEITGSATVAQWQQGVFAPGEQQPLQEFVETVFPDLTIFSPHNRKSLDLSRKERIGPKDNNAVRTILNRITQAFGLAEIDLYIKANLGMPYVLVTHDGPAIALDAHWVKSWNKNQMSFLIGMLLSQLLNQRHLIATLPPIHIERLVRLVLLPFLTEKPPSSPAIENEISIIRDVLSRKTRKWLQDNGAKAVAQLQRTDFAKWQTAIEMTSWRAGLTFCIRLADAAHAMRQLKPDSAKTPGWQSPSFRTIATYLISEEAATLRGVLGSSIHSS